MNGATTTTQPYTLAGRPVSLVDRLARKAVLKMFGRISHGRLIVEEDNHSFTFGDGQNPLQARICIHAPQAYRRILMGGSIGAGEAYIEKLWDTDDLTKLIRILAANMAVVDKMEKGLALLQRPWQILGHLLRRNNRNGSKKNILSHYDLGNEMYATFLDPTMMYSSAIFPHPEASLEEAALHKLEVVCRKLDLQPTDHVIEIGSGWGGFAMYAAGRYGCRVTTTTISDAQYHEAKRRIEAAGLGDRITLLQTDYRDLQGSFDKLVSIEMIEAVGHSYLPGFFTKCGTLLKENGRMLLQAITIRDQQYQSYVRNVDFIQKHIFPGGCLPSNTRMAELLSDKTDMVIRHIEDYGLDYARTICEWRRRFNAAFSGLKAEGYDERFRRLWNFYFSYCEGGFLERSISVVHVVAERPGAPRP
ncbi:MAG: cyclopropane-fatty-acyl-phospholipid synthase [Desulfobulbaceae bacterium BRH_c16a]|nr:MAG: cyclopropane-fatty-acyl-phospholipid synthase [Desulfobulbaceae bacterium BRH_c16a]